MDIEIRSLRESEVGRASELYYSCVDNLGLLDLQMQLSIDRESVFVAATEKGIAGCVTTFKYPWFFGVLGPCRTQKGVGTEEIRQRLLQTAMKRLEGYNIALEIPPAESEPYLRHGFKPGGTTAIFCGTVRPPANIQAGVVTATRADIEELVRFDAASFGFERGPALNALFKVPGAVTVVCRIRSEFKGYAMARPTKGGYRIGPIMAADGKSATWLYQGLFDELPPESKAVVEVPSANPDAGATAKETGLIPVGELQRFFTGYDPFKTYGNQFATVSRTLL